MSIFSSAAQAATGFGYALVVVVAGGQTVEQAGEAGLSLVLGPAQQDPAQVEATWWIYQRIVTAYRDPDRTAAKTALTKVIDALSTGVPPALTELITLGRTLRPRAGALT